MQNKTPIPQNHQEKLNQVRQNEAKILLEKLI
jgi:hypothetical protein